MSTLQPNPITPNQGIGVNESKKLKNWPFADPPNVAVFTLRRIFREGKPILHVTHDKDDGSWQFLDGGPADMEDAWIVGLGEVLNLDDTIAELADLPLGWMAWRATLTSPWQRKPHTIVE